MHCIERGNKGGARDQVQNSRVQGLRRGTGGRRASPALHGLSAHERENEKRTSVPLEAPRECAVRFAHAMRRARQQSSCVVVCGSRGNTAVSASGGAAALPEQAARECAVRFARAIRRARLHSSRRASSRRASIHLARWVFNKKKKSRFEKIQKNLDLFVASTRGAAPALSVAPAL